MSSSGLGVEDTKNAEDLGQKFLVKDVGGI